MNDTKKTTVGELAASNYKYADVFMKHGIDFCCGGGISLQEACTKRNLDFDEILNELRKMDMQNGSVNESSLPLDELIDLIESKHHAYLRENLPLILDYSEKVATVHGEKHTELLKVREYLQDLEAELMPHLNKEEVILFPFIKKMLGDSSILALPIDTVGSPINVMLAEHEVAGDILKALNRLTNGYQLPEDACMTYTVFYQKLKELEADLFLHIHLENNILFPKAIDFERNMTS